MGRQTHHGTHVQHDNPKGRGRVPELLKQPYRLAGTASGLLLQKDSLLMCVDIRHCACENGSHPVSVSGDGDEGWLSLIRGLRTPWTLAEVASSLQRTVYAGGSEVTTEERMMLLEK